MRLVIIGGGFAGMYAALSAARLREMRGVSPETVEIALVAPEPTLVVRPRLYEPKPETLTAPLEDVFKAIDVTYVQGSADTETCAVEVVTAEGRRKALSFPKIPSLAIRAMRQNRRIIRYDARDPPTVRDVRRQPVQIAASA